MDMKWFYEVCAAGHEAEKDLQGSPLPRAAVPGEDGRDQKPGHQGDVHGVRLGAQEGQAVGDEEGELGEVQDQGQGRCCRLCPCRSSTDL